MGGDNGELVGDSQEVVAGVEPADGIIRLKRKYPVRHRVAGIASRALWRAGVPLALAVAEFETGYLVGERVRVEIYLDSHIVELCSVLSKYPPPESSRRGGGGEEIGGGLPVQISEQRVIRVCVTAVQTEGLGTPKIVVGYEFLSEAED